MEFTVLEKKDLEVLKSINKLLKEILQERFKYSNSVTDSRTRDLKLSIKYLTKIIKK